MGIVVLTTAGLSWRQHVPATWKPWMCSPSVQLAQCRRSTASSIRGSPRLSRLPDRLIALRKSA
nr:hypothetical protein [Kibdelosporangium sp. MJ126-NF4]CTQ90859.1 hypothetical protein [Kibdelosporangium sp. MJ126-NF4]